MILADQSAKVAKANAEVRGRVVQLLLGNPALIVSRRSQHHLSQANGANGARSVRIKIALELDESERQLRIDSFRHGCVKHMRREIRRNGEAAGELNDAIRTLVASAEEIHLSLRRVERFAQLARTNAET